MVTVPGPVWGLEGQPASDVTAGMGAANTTLPGPGGSGPSPRPSFGREGPSLAVPSLAGPWLFLSGLSPCSPPSLCSSDIRLSCIPEDRMAGQADTASTLVGSGAGALSSGFFCPHSRRSGLGGGPELPRADRLRPELGAPGGGRSLSSSLISDSHFTGAVGNAPSPPNLQPYLFNGCSAAL